MNNRKYPFSMSNLYNVDVADDGRQVEACERRCMSSCMDQSRRPVKYGWEAAGKCTAIMVHVEGTNNYV